MAITTIDNIKLWLSRTELTELQEAQITMLIPLVESTIENYCGWKLLARDYTKAGSGNGAVSFDLGISPVSSVESVVLDGVDITDKLTLDNLEGTLTFTDGESVFTAPSTTGTKNMTATFNAGYDVASEIEEIASDARSISGAADILLVMWFNKIDDRVIGIAEEKENFTTTKYESLDLPFVVRRTLDRYRKLSIY